MVDEANPVVAVRARRTGDATAAVAALSMLAAPTAVGIAEADAGAAEADAGLRCVAPERARVERRLGGNADIAFELTKGTQVALLGVSDGKSRVRYRVEGHKRVGWVDSQNLSDCASAHAPVTPVPPRPPVATLPNRRSPETNRSSELPPLQEREMRAHYIDVGQGAATLYEFSCGAVLVDTGGEDEGDFDSNPALESYLKGFFDERPDLERTVDLLVISHPHSDHDHGAALVTEKFKVKNVVTNGLLKDPHGGEYSGGPEQAALEKWAKERAKLETIAVAEIPKGGKTDAIIDPVACAGEDPQIRALWGAVSPQPPDWNYSVFKNANNHSVALRIDFGKASFLTTGDLQNEAVSQFIALHQGSGALDVDVWEASHHGSANGCDDSTLGAITPAIALLATGDPMRHGTHTAFAYGHPRKAIVEELEQRVTSRRGPVQVPVANGVRDFENFDLKKGVFATGWDGTVVVTATADGEYKVQTSR